jgi:hypothetical protein
MIEQYEKDFLELLAQEIEALSLEITTHEGGKLSHTLQDCATLRRANFENTKKLCAQIVRDGLI